MFANKASPAIASGDSEQLILIINANPILDTVTELIHVFLKLSPKNPEKTDVHALALVGVLENSGKVSKINIREPQDEDFNSVFRRYIYHHLTAILYESSTTFIQPNNNYIVASFISDVVIRTGLCFSSAQIREISRGLHFSGSEYKSHWGPERYEINAVGACVHLVAAGKEVYKGS